MLAKAVESCKHLYIYYYIYSSSKALLPSLPSLHTLTPSHPHTLTPSQTTQGSSLKDFKTMRERDEVKKALSLFVSERPAVKVRLVRAVLQMIII